MILYCACSSRILIKPGSLSLYFSTMLIFPISSLSLASPARFLKSSQETAYLKQCIQSKPQGSFNLKIVLKGNLVRGFRIARQASLLPPIVPSFEGHVYPLACAIVGKVDKQVPSIRVFLAGRRGQGNLRPCILGWLTHQLDHLLKLAKIGSGEDSNGGALGHLLLPHHPVSLATANERWCFCSSFSH